MEVVNVSLGSLQLLEVNINHQFHPIETLNNTKLEYKEIRSDVENVYLLIIAEFDSSSIVDEYKLSIKISWDLKLSPKSSVDSELLWKASLMPLKHMDEIIATIYKNQDQRPKVKPPSYLDYKDELDDAVAQL